MPLAGLRLTWMVLMSPQRACPKGNASNMKAVLRICKINRKGWKCRPTNQINCCTKLSLCTKSLWQYLTCSQYAAYDDKANNTREIALPWLTHFLLNRKAKDALTTSFKNMLWVHFLALFISLRWKPQEHLVCIKRTVHSKTTSTDGTDVLVLF